MLEDVLVDELMRATSREPTDPSEPTAAPEPKQPQAAAAPHATPAADAWWAYCVLPAAESDAAPIGLPGVEPSGAIELIRQGDLAALVSPVPLTEFSDEHLREHLNDVEWLERVARAHEAVLERTLENATVLPLRLCTLYKDRAGVKRMLVEQGSALRRALQSLAGRREWGVKLFADDERVAEAAAAEAGARTAAGGSAGAAYMARRQHQREISGRARELGDNAAHEVHSRLERVVEVARSLPLQRPEAHGRDERMLLNGAYLVEREREREFEAEVASLRERWGESGFELELTGPWPSYNFASASELVMP